MPNKCCVRGCNSNTPKGERVTVFSFPKDQERRQEWLHRINRPNYVVTKTSVVCAKHFEEELIIRVDVATRNDGSVLTVPRGTPKLSKHAAPTIFYNLQCTKKDKRSKSKKCATKLEDEDFIKNFGDLKYNYQTKLEIVSSNSVVCTDNVVCIFEVNAVAAIPYIIYSVKINNYLETQVCYKGRILDDLKVKVMLGSKSVCDRWSLLNELVQYLKSVFT